MGGAWRKGDRRSSLTYSSRRNEAQNKRRNEKLDRHGNKRKSVFSPRRHDGGDDFASRHTKHRSPQSRHPHHLNKVSTSRTPSTSRSRSMSRKPFEYYDSRHCKCRESENRHLHSIKEEPLEPRSCRTVQNYKKGETTYSKRRRSSSDSQHHKSLVPVEKKRKYEENVDLSFVEEKRPSTSSSLKEFSNYFLERSNKYMTEGSLKKALRCINIALKVCKKEDKFSAKLYSRRGTIYSLLEKPRCTFQGFLDWEHAYIIDKDNIEARVNMSKVFFKAANKLFRNKAYNRALTLCNHALGLHIRNGEASVLFKLLKRKLFETQLSKDSTSKVTKVYPTSTSMICNPENLSIAKYELHEAVLDEVKRLNNLIAEALKTNSYPQALKYCDLALRLFKGDIPDDNVYCDLLVLKQKLIATLPGDISENVRNS